MSKEPPDSGKRKAPGNTNEEFATDSQIEEKD
jgi:hypothetical protein